jgi:predicted AAA+ superfamily ATPase
LTIVKISFTVVSMNIKRNIINRLIDQIGSPKISLLIGPRQVGKTFLLRELEDEVKSRGMSSHFFDLEQPEDLLAFGATEREQVQVLLQSGQVIFVDELHLLSNISKLFKAVFDRRIGIKIFASGSSALEMHRHLKESLAGRLIVNRIFPLTLEELRQSGPHRTDTLLRFGGMPGLVHEDSDEGKVTELQAILSTYITKDIKALIREENIRAFNHLLYLIAQNQGSLTVVANLAREVNLSKPTMDKYLEVMAQTYVCHPVYSYAGNNLANELKKSRKYYLYDLGIRNCLLKDFLPADQRQDGGVMRESFVFLSLLRQLKPNMEIRFWRTKRGDEVDFVLLKNRLPLPVEVKSHLSSAEVPKSLKTFLDLYPKAPAAIVYNESFTAEVSHAGRSVFFLPLEAAETNRYMQDLSGADVV